MQVEEKWQSAAFSPDLTWGWREECKGKRRMLWITESQKLYSRINSQISQMQQEDTQPQGTGLS